MPEHDPWGGTSGLRDDFDGTITSLKFTYDSNYNNGQTLIGLVEIDCEDGGEPELLKLSTGSGWEDDAKGTKAKREDGSDPKGFNRSCNLQRFFMGAAETEFLDAMKKSVPWDGTIWAGERFHFARKEFPNFDPTKEPTEVTIPTEYLGAAEGAAKKAAPAKATKSEAPKESAAERAKRLAAEKKANAAGDAVASDDPLVEVAKAAESHDEFIELAYALEGFDADAREADIVDDAFYVANHG